MTPRILLLILASVSLGALAQVSLKRGMSAQAVQQALAGNELLGKVLAVGLSPLVIVGIGLYGLSMVVWLLVLARVDVSQAYPFVGLGFVLTLGAGVIVLGEPLTATRVAGVLLVAAGVFFLARG